MNIEILYPAIDVVRASGYRGNARETTFMRTYPLLLAAVRSPAANPAEAFLRTASLAYGWMPQALRLEPAYLNQAATACEAARDAEPAISPQMIEPIASCLGSLIGAAQVLHLTNPSAFPLWNPRVERFRLQGNPSAYHMTQSRNYLAFVNEIQIIAAHPLFLTFHHEYCTAYQARLQRLRIPAYPLTETRVIESAASELACQ